ncbi:MAG: restriction endonuclease subunit S [Chloroflexi bacterium]|nr:restriction endonuclease subunit S [Chloroflexota bacterium]
MSSNDKRLGDYISLVDERNSGSTITQVLGISINKKYIPTVANLSETDLSKYQIIQKNQFLINLMQIGRDNRLGVALYDSKKPAIVSPAYKIFAINQGDGLLPAYLMLIFLRSEFDRYCSYVCDSSIRASLEWSRFCDIPIPVPTPKIQECYSSVYHSLLQLQRSHEESLDSLESIINTFMEELAKVTPRQKLADHIRQVDVRNQDLEITDLRGISTSKEFIHSKAKQGKLDLSLYKIVRPQQFAYVADTSRRGDKIAMALMHSNIVIVSSIYTVFEVIDSQKLLPEFLLLWVKRPEFNRYARFHSWGSARETFNWDDMCRVSLPIPSIKVQKSIVAMHRVLETRKRLNEALRTKLHAIAPVLIRGVTQNT